MIVAASIGDVLVKYGLPPLSATIAAVVATAWLTARRERAAARRAWLADALASFYAPVHAKLELQHRWLVKYVKQREQEQGLGDPVGLDGLGLGLDHKLVEASIRIDAELADLIERHLHYVSEPGLQEAALAFLASSHMTRWKREVLGVPNAEGGGRVLLPREVERSDFHALIASAFVTKTREFAQLTTGR